MSTETLTKSRERERRIVTIYNNKGGVLKTTLAFNLAKNYMRNNRSVTTVDFDQQANLSRLLPETIRNPEMADLETFDCDYIIVDTGPAFSPDHVQLFVKSKLLIVPCPLEGMDVEQTVKLFDTMKAMSLVSKVKVVLVHSGNRSVMYKHLQPVITAICAEYGIEIICEIVKSQAVCQANLEKKSVFEYTTPRDVRTQYKNYFKEIGRCLAN
jgi:cellulose biosynthesis protein BcsQ